MTVDLSTIGLLYLSRLKLGTSE